MNKKIKLLILICVLALFCLFLVSCSDNRNPPYEKYDKDGYTVSVKYDSNGGYFGSSGNLCLLDTYKYSELPDGANGKKEVYLIDPNSEWRVSDSGDKANQYNIADSVVEGCFFAGWYQERTPVLDSETGEHKKDEFKNYMYTYSGYWDFDKPYLIDADPSKYSANNPVITLYAAWVRTPTIKIYEKIDGVDVQIATYDIKSANTEGQNIVKMPYFTLNDKGIHSLNFADLDDARIFVADESTDTSIDIETDTNEGTESDENGNETNEAGSIGKKYKWGPRERELKTNEDGQIISTTFFNGFYTDKDRINKTGETFVHPYQYDKETATIINPTVNLYVDFETRDGEWFRIYSAQEFINEENKKDDKWPLGKEIKHQESNFELMDDIIFNSDYKWPDVLTKSTFKGKIIGNGHSFVNPSITYTGGTNRFAGLFRKISADAKIEDVTFENATLTVQNAHKAGKGVNALVAAEIEDGFKFENVSLNNCKIIIISSFSTETLATNTNNDYQFGLVCAVGYHDGLGIDPTSITCEVVINEDSVNNIIVTVDSDNNKLLFSLAALEPKID